MRKEVIEQHLLLMLNQIYRLPNEAPRSARSVMMQWEVPAKLWPQYHEHYMVVSERVLTQNDEIVFLSHVVDAMPADMLLLGALHYIKQQLEFGKAEYSICPLVTDYFNSSLSCRVPSSKQLEAEQRMDKLFEAWPHFSGDINFPVPSARGWKALFFGTTPFFAYTNAMDKEAVWKGHYGSLRKDLLNYMIQQLEAQL